MMEATYFLFLTTVIFRAVLVNADCGEPPTIDNASHNGAGSQYIEGSVVVYSCELGYTIDGPVKYTCRGGNWEDGNVVCRIKSCPSVDPPANGGYADAQRSRTVGSTLRFTCNQCYSLHGSSSIICRADGAWTNPPPTCQIKKCPEYTINNGILDQDFTTSSDKNACGRIGNVECSSGYSVHGPSQISCQSDNTWSGNPTCEKTNCGPLPVTNDACLEALSDQTTTVNSAPIIICRKEATLVGNMNPICRTDGQWSENPGRCYCSCYPSLNLAGVEYFGLKGGRYLSHGSILNWHCQSGFDKSTTIPIGCVNGKFTMSYSCIARNIPTPEESTTRSTPRIMTPQPQPTVETKPHYFPTKTSYFPDRKKASESDFSYAHTTIRSPTSILPDRSAFKNGSSSVFASMVVLLCCFIVLRFTAAHTF